MNAHGIEHDYGKFLIKKKGLLARVTGISERHVDEVFGAIFQAVDDDVALSHDFTNDPCLNGARRPSIGVENKHDGVYVEVRADNLNYRKISEELGSAGYQIIDSELNGERQ